MQQSIFIGLLSHCSVIVIGFIKSIFKYNYQFMSIFNILILMMIDCVGVMSVFSIEKFNMYNICIFNIYIILITMFTSLLVN